MSMYFSYVNRVVFCFKNLLNVFFGLDFAYYKLQPFRVRRFGTNHVFLSLSPFSLHLLIPNPSPSLPYTPSLSATAKSVSLFLFCMYVHFFLPPTPFLQARGHLEGIKHTEEAKLNQNKSQNTLQDRFIREEKGIPPCFSNASDIYGGRHFLTLSYSIDCFVDSLPSSLMPVRSSLRSLGFEQLHNASYLKTDSNCASISIYNCHSEKMSCKFKMVKQSFSSTNFG